MWNPFQFLKQQISSDFLGVDIGTTSIKMTEVDQGERGPRLLNYALLESQSSLTRPNTALQTSGLKLSEQETVELLREALKKMKPRTKTALASLPSFSAFTTVLSFPQMSSGDLAKTIAFQAKEYVPLPMSEVAIDWLKVGEYEDEKGVKFEQILLISVPQEHIKRYQTIFKATGLNLRALEIEPLALSRSLVGADQSATLVVDIGSRSTSLSVVDKGQLKFVSQSDYAGSSLTQAIVSSLNINPLRAEEMKREKGIEGTGPNFELSTIMIPFLDVIINEAKRAQFNYESQFAAAPKLERVILSGGGANLLGIEKYFSKQFGLPAVKAAPLLRFEYPPLLESLLSEINPLLSVSLGLTLREF